MVFPTGLQEGKDLQAGSVRTYHQETEDDADRENG